MVSAGVLAILAVLVVILIALVFTALTRGLRSPSRSQASQPLDATPQLPAQSRPLIDPTQPIPAAPSDQVSPANQATTEEEPMANDATFAPLIGCIDGRVQRPLSDWVGSEAHTNDVDTITIPGPDKALISATPERLIDLRQYVDISLVAHGSRFVAVAGHFDCAANPVSPDEHREMIRQAVDAVRDWGL